MEEIQKHSRLGIASFILSLAVGFSLLVLFAVAAVLSQGHIERGEAYPGQTLVGLVAIALFACDIAAVGLGIASVCQSARKRVFGILGLVFASLTILCAGALITVGVIYASSFANS